MKHLMRHKKKLLFLLITAILITWFMQRDTATEIIETAVVVEQVNRGDVTSGIETTGEIIAAQKLDLDVYRQTTRIEAVNVVNGGRVEANDVILAFDTSDAFVEVQSAQVEVADAQLTLNNERENATDPNTQLGTLQNDIAELQTEITQFEVDAGRALRTYLNANLEAEPANPNAEDKTPPTITGLYTSDQTGEYLVQIYRSSANSGHSYRVTDLETGTLSIVPGIPTKLGNNGLEILFSTPISSGDEWTIAVPNIYAPEYIQNRETYESAITDIDLAITNAQVTIANKRQEIEDLLQNDSAEFRDLEVARAEARLSQAQETLSQNFDVVQEQNIVAPFSGTVEGMENVVVGASPTRDTDDPITLGTLISDDFLATFSLGAVDVAKVEVGQLVLVTVTSFPEAPTLNARITEISSLPNSDGVAQYEVQALITVPDDLPITLREGLLADIEIVEEVARDVLRVPSAAITYTNRQAQVRVADRLNPEQQQTVDTLSIIRLQSDQEVGYLVDVTVGITGAFYTEITNGLTAGQYIVVGDTDDTESVIETNQRGGPPDRD